MSKENNTMCNDEVLEVVINKFEDANHDLRTKLRDRDPDLVEELVLRVNDVIDHIECMEEDEKEDV